MRPPKLPALVFRAAVLAGVLVGTIDGLRTSVLGHLQTLGLLACFTLTLASDALAAAVGGAALALLIGMASWGRRREAAAVASVAAWVLAGGLAASSVAAAVFGIARCNDRIFAACAVVGTSLVVSAVACFVGLALTRVFSRLPHFGSKACNPNTRFRISVAGIILLAPLVALSVEAVVFLVVWYARLPAQAEAMGRPATIAATVSTPLPFLLALASTRLSRVRWWQAAAAATTLLGAPLVCLVHARWTEEFRFLPWATVDVIAGLAGATLGCALLLRRRVLRRTWNLAIDAGIPVFSAISILTASTHEPARKAALEWAGLAGRLLAHGQYWFAECDTGVAAAATVPTPGFYPVPDAVPSDLNILLVTIDTLRADHLGCYGYTRDTSPNLDRLAEESTVFVNGWAHAPSTRFSMPAIATGRWPSTIDWDESIWWPRIALSQPTIAQSFKSSGYTTGAFYAYSYFNRADQRGFERSVDYYDDSCAALHVNVDGPAGSVGTSARQMADKGIDFLHAHGREKFFLWMHFYDPHLNYERHPEAPNFGSSQADLYDAEIWFTDKHFGRMLDELRTLGLWQRTAIVVVSDHGESLGEHGILAHGYHLYRPQTKVPFIVRVPGLPPQRVTAPVGHVDLAPTLLNLVRGPQEPSFLGRSLVDLLAGKPAVSPRESVFQEVTYEGNVKRRALVTSSHHLIWNWTPDNTTECYDIVHDPDETKDLWGLPGGEPTCSQLKDELRKRVALLSLPPGYREKIAYGVLAPGVAGGDPTHPLDARIGSSLRVSGYDLSPDPIRRGDSAELVTHFEVLGAVEPEWKLFYHMEGPAGFHNLDHVPVEGAYPMERWRPGQRIRDRLRIAFTTTMPPGRYTVYVGAFRGSQRLSVSPTSASDGNDRLLVAQILVP